MLGDLSVIDPPFLLTLGALALAVFVAGWRPARRRWMRYGVRGLGVVMIVLVTAGAINARYEYLPTWTSLFGKSAADQISLARLRQLERGDGRLASTGEDARGRHPVLDPGHTFALPCAPRAGVPAARVLPLAPPTAARDRTVGG